MRNLIVASIALFFGLFATAGMADSYSDVGGGVYAYSGGSGFMSNVNHYGNFGVGSSSGDSNGFTSAGTKGFTMGEGYAIFDGVAISGTAGGYADAYQGYGFAMAEAGSSSSASATVGFVGDAVSVSGADAGATAVNWAW